MIKYLMSGSALAIVLVAAPPVSAQQAAAANGIGDVVVTAQRREESAQKAALAIEVFKGDQLRQLGVVRVDDLTKLAPGLQIAGGSTPQIYIRGVGDFGVVATANPAVATSLDGVGINRPQAVPGNFFDLERIEVLKGPQSTLYGRNASGGALNLIAVQPKFGQFGGYLEAGAGNHSLYSLEGAVNLPLGDKAALRVSAQGVSRKGYITDGTDDDKHESVRVQAKFKPTDKLTIHTEGTYSHLGGIGSGVVVLTRAPGESPWTGVASAAGAADYANAALQQFLHAPPGAAPPPALFDTPDRSKLFQDITSYSANAQVDYDFGPATLTLIPAYRRTTAKFGLQPSFLYSPGGDGTAGETSDQYSMEARLGHNGPKLKWVLGFYGLREDQTTDFAVDTGLIQRIRVASDLGTRAYAAFGQATYSVTDALRVTAGVRYTSDKRDQTHFQKFGISPTVVAAPGGPPCLPVVGFPPGTQCNLLPPGANYDSVATFNRATWKVGAEFDVAPQSLLFANISTGFKAGGFNQAVDLVDTTKTLAFSPENLTAYTVGLKNRLLGNRLQINLEGFYWDYKNLQLSALALDGSGNVSLETQNAGKARIYGIDVDIVAKPWSGATVHAGIEQLHSRYIDFAYVQAGAFTNPLATGCAVTPSSLTPGPAGPFVNINCSGFQLVRAPSWSGSVGAEQKFNVGGGGNVALAGDVGFASSRFVNTDFVAGGHVKGYAVLSGSLTYNAPMNGIFVSGYVRNITNTPIYAGGGGGESPFIAGFLTTSIGAPRTYGVRVGASF